MRFRSDFLSIWSLCGLILLSVTGCPKNVEPVKTVTAVSKAEKPKKTSKKKKKKKKSPKQTLGKAERAKSKYPCQEYRCEEAYRTFAARHHAHQKPVGVKAVDAWRTQYKKKESAQRQRPQRSSFASGNY